MTRKIPTLHITKFGKLSMALTLALVWGATAVSSAELTGPKENDQQVAELVSLYMQQAHMSRHALDDQMAERWLSNFLKSLDPMKVYFNQADVDEFRRDEKKLPKWVQDGDIRYAYTVYNRFLQRVAGRVKLAEELLDAQHDFTVAEEMPRLSEAAHYAKDDADARDIWRKRIKYDLLVETYEHLDKKYQDGKDAEALQKRTEAYEKARAKLHRRYTSFGKRMAQTDSDELLEMFLTAMTTAYDPHSTYMSPSSLENFQISMSLELEGIGAALRYEDGFTIVSDIVPGGAADKDSRLKREDRIVGVGQGKDGEIVDTVEMKLSDVVKMIRGPGGSIVRLLVELSGKKERVIYDITRAKIELKGSEARSIIIDAGQKPNGKPYKVGVINLPSFYMDMSAAQNGKDDYKSSTRDVKKILDDPKDGFKAQNVDVVILDLRSNGGGSLPEAISLTGLFIDKGPVVQVKDFKNDVESLDDEEAGTAWDGPLVVLTSRFSASASEILAGAIQDYHRGLVIGDPATHGKGTVQSLLDLGRRIPKRFWNGPNAPALGALKLTMQQFYRPNGDSTQNRGVLADISLPSLVSHMDVGEEHLDYAMKFDHVPAAKYSAMSMVNDSILQTLKGLSSSRMEKNEDFLKVKDNIQKYEDRKGRKMVSIQESAYVAERKALEAQEKESKDAEEVSIYDRPVVERNFYFNEAMDITLDYVQLLEKLPQATKK